MRKLELRRKRIEKAIKLLEDQLTHCHEKLQELNEVINTRNANEFTPGARKRFSHSEYVRYNG